MSYYADLSPYAYTYKTSEIALNVGWLSGDAFKRLDALPAGA